MTETATHLAMMARNNCFKGGRSGSLAELRDLHHSSVTDSHGVSLTRPMVEISGISKFFTNRVLDSAGEPQKFTALSSVSATVGRGEFVTLLGPSGCGKTTLLRIVAGLTMADEGAVTIDGSVVIAPRKDACFVFQHVGLLPWRTVLANIEFPLELDGVSKREIAERAKELLSFVGLEKFANHLPHEISGGMQQRVAIARALIRKPIMLFMDEPFGALDAQTREQLQEEFLKIWAKIGMTVIFVTHSIDEALILSDRIIVLESNPGRIKSTILSPVSGQRLTGDPRAHPDYATCRAELREMLREDTKRGEST